MAFITNIELPSGMVAVNSYCSIQVNSSKPIVTVICNFYVSAEDKAAVIAQNMRLDSGV